MGKVRKGLKQYLKPLQERIIYDLFCLGLCVVEIIQKEDAWTTFVGLMELEKESKLNIFNEGRWKSYGPSLRAFLTNVLVCMPCNLALITTLK